MAVDPPVVALVELLAPAEEARTAGGRIGAEDPVADGDAAHLVAGRDHLSDELVDNHETRRDLDPPVVDVEARPPDAARLPADDRIVRRHQLGHGDVLELDLAGG